MCALASCWPNLVRKLPPKNRAVLIHTGVAAMESLANWIDAKPYRFTLILLAHTAVVGAILAATARF
jgi:hypothetical protein